MKDKQAQQQHGCVGSAVPRRYQWDQIRGVCTFNIALIKTVMLSIKPEKKKSSISPFSLSSPENYRSSDTERLVAKGLY